VEVYLTRGLNVASNWARHQSCESL
jgi:hypothetical protein